MADVRAGSIVSLHFGYADTVAALPGLLRRTRPPRPARGDHHGVADLMPPTVIARALVAAAALHRPRRALAGCGTGPRTQPHRPIGAVKPAPPGQTAVPVRPAVQGLPGMPPVLDPDGRVRRRPAEQALAGRQGLPVPGLRAQHRVQHGLRHRPEDVRGHRDDPRRPPAPARRPLLGPEDPVGQQRPRQHPHAHRPEDRQGGQAGRRPRPVQPLLHAQRQVRRRHGLPRPPARLPRPAHHEDRQDRARSAATASTTPTSPPTAGTSSCPASSAANCSRSTPRR